MTIQYTNGQTKEAVLLSRTEDSLRVIIAGADDVTEFTLIHDTWVSADCEPVTIEFAWQRRERKPTVTEADCCCSKELAASLIHLLYTDSSDDEMDAEAALLPGTMPAGISQIV